MPAESLLEPPAKPANAPLLEIPTPDGGTISKEAIRTLSIAGMSDVDILAKFPALKDVTLRQWRFKDPVWAEAYSALRNGQNQTRSKAELTAEHNASITKTTISDVLAENGQQSNLLASGIARRSLERAPEALEVTSPADLKTLLSVARIAAGMDKQAPVVSLNLWGDSQRVPRDIVTGTKSVPEIEMFDDGE